MAGPTPSGAAELRILRLRLVLVSIFALTALAAFGADPIRAFLMPDGRIRLWLRGAPSITAMSAAGWKIDPPGKEKDKTWLDRLKSTVPASSDSPWKTLLDDLASGVAVPGVSLIEAKVTIEVEAASGGNLNVKASDANLGKVSAKFQPTSTGYASSEVDPLSKFVIAKVGISDPALIMGLAREAGIRPTISLTKPVAWSDFLKFVVQAGNSAPPIFVDAASGPAVVSVRVSKAEISPPAVPTVEVVKPKPSSDAVNGELPWLIIGLAGLGGTLLGVGAHAISTRRSKSMMKKELTDTKARLADREAELTRAKASLDQSSRSAKEYREQHAEWLKERDSTLLALNEVRAAYAKAQTAAETNSSTLRRAWEESQRSQADAIRQLEALKKSHFQTTASLDQMTGRASGYAELAHQTSDAFNYIQSEIGRPETAAAVGYLLSYSCAELLNAVAEPRPALEQAMLANIVRIASQFPSTAHARKLSATANKLVESLGAATIVESKNAHAHARHFDEVLRFLRHQRGLELSPFYFGADEAGAIHAVYV